MEPYFQFKIKQRENWRTSIIIILTFIIQRLLKALLKSKIIYNIDLIYNDGLVPAITSLSVFLRMRPESILLAGLAKSLVLKKWFCFY